MKKTLYPFIYLLLTFSFIFPAFAQLPTGSFQKLVTHNTASRVLEYYVPPSYSPTTSYPLVVGMHGCIGGTNPSAAYRNELAFLADSIGAIVVCPNGIMSSPFSGMMDDPDEGMILVAIDTTTRIYNIDTTQVYLTGFSCNGYVTAKYGTRELYPWKGIIPFNASFLSGDFTNGSFDFTTDVPTCVCVGSVDPGLALNQRFRDSLDVNGVPYLYNLMPGIGHVTGFATYPQELMECFNWINNPITSIENVKDPVEVSVFPNPASDQLLVRTNTTGNQRFLLTALIGQKVLESELNSSSPTKVDIQKLPRGIYLWKVVEGSQLIGSGKLLIH